MRVKELLGKEVLDVHGNKVGKVADLEIDIMPGVIHDIIIKSGLTKKYHIKVDDIVTVGDRMILRLDADKMRQKSAGQ